MRATRRLKSVSRLTRAPQHRDQGALVPDLGHRESSERQRHPRPSRAHLFAFRVSETAVPAACAFGTQPSCPAGPTRRARKRIPSQRTASKCTGPSVRTAGAQGRRAPVQSPSARGSDPRSCAHCRAAYPVLGPDAGQERRYVDVRSVSGRVRLSIGAGAFDGRRCGRRRGGGRVVGGRHLCDEVDEGLYVGGRPVRGVSQCRPRHPDPCLPLVKADLLPHLPCLCRPELPPFEETVQTTMLVTCREASGVRAEPYVSIRAAIGLGSGPTRLRWRAVPPAGRRTSVSSCQSEPRLSDASRVARYPSKALPYRHAARQHRPGSQPRDFAKQSAEPRASEDACADSEERGSEVKLRLRERESHPVPRLEFSPSLVLLSVDEEVASSRADVKRSAR